MGRFFVFYWRVQMISRAYKVTGGSPEQSTSTAPVLAGLVSALRPVKRVSTQLAEESLLLRRFSYKNKNQHKGCGWWRKVIEVDRVMERLGTELEGLLGEFGFECVRSFFGVWRELTWLRRAGSKTRMRLGGSRSTRWCKGCCGFLEPCSLRRRCVQLSRLSAPRTQLIPRCVQSLSVLLGSARFAIPALLTKRELTLRSPHSILEQLLHSRAFMAFALVVVSLIARLHSLTTVLSLELSKLSLVLTRLVRPAPARSSLPASSNIH